MRVSFPISTMLTLSGPTACPANSGPPEHHVFAASTAQAPSVWSWSSYLPSWGPLAQSEPEPGETIGFRNPWPSWKKGTLAEVWQHLQWGEAHDPCVELAASHLSHDPTPKMPEQGKRPSFGDIGNWPNSLGAKAARLLQIEDPDFSFPSAANPDALAKVTWLGHAGLLVQLPALGAAGSRPLGCLFDPIFSTRSSPSESAGPIRSYPAPCKVEDLPPIDIVCISHNHQDHMNELTLRSIWEHNKDTVRFFVPLKNKHYLVSFGIPPDRIHELDWWESVDLTDPSSSSTNNTLKVWCTPSQHNSIRTGNDANTALWSSWYLERLSSSSPPFRVFFAGDTGYQFHASSTWPPSPNNPEEAEEEENPYPACPAFSQIRTRIGPPNLLLLPISVGATFAYLRSFVPLPNWINPFPRHSDGVTAANHMPPWDAVRVMKIMTEGMMGTQEGAVAVGMHWGTFVVDPEEVLKTLGELEWACERLGVGFGRGQADVRTGRDVFLALNHGGSVFV